MEIGEHIKIWEHLSIEILDILIIFVFFILLYNFIKKTDAIRVFLGIMVLFLVYWIVDKAGLSKTAFLFEKAFELMAIGILVIFHQELRMFLKKIGGFADIKIVENEEELLLVELKKAVFSMSEKKIGALIILDTNKHLILTNGTMVNAQCTDELIETIFYTNSPLHDGAVIIQKGKITRAGVKLPFSGTKREELGFAGTRHHVGLETAINNNVISIIVSEETGAVSIANHEGIFKIKNEEMFEAFFNDEEHQVSKTIMNKNIISFKKLSERKKKKNKK